MVLTLNRYQISWSHRKMISTSRHTQVRASDSEKITFERNRRKENAKLLKSYPWIWRNCLRKMGSLSSFPISRIVSRSQASLSDLLISEILGDCIYSNSDFEVTGNIKYCLSRHTCQPTILLDKRFNWTHGLHTTHYIRPVIIVIFSWTDYLT